MFEPWLYRLTVNAAYDYLRKQKRRKESRMSDLSEQAVVMADAAAGGKVETEEARTDQGSRACRIPSGKDLGRRPDPADDEGSGRSVARRNWSRSTR